MTSWFPRFGARFIGRQRPRKHLDGDVALEPRIAGAVDLAHPPAQI
jgi:hypothetical protein